MLFDHPTSTQLSQVIGQVTAPAFLLGAVAAFVSVLISRMNRIIDRLQALNAVGDDNPGKAQLKSDIPHLKRRAALLNKSIFFAIISAIITSILVIVAFLAASLNVPHEYGVGFLFILALSFFTASLVNLARETRIALHDYDHFSDRLAAAAGLRRRRMCALVAFVDLDQRGAKCVQLEAGLS